MLTYTFQVGQDIVPEETPNLNNSCDQLLVFYSIQFGVYGNHALSDEFRSVILKSRQGFGWSRGYNRLNVPLH